MEDKKITNDENRVARGIVSWGGDGESVIVSFLLGRLCLQLPTLHPHLLSLFSLGLLRRLYPQVCIIMLI